MQNVRIVYCRWKIVYVIFVPMQRDIEKDTGRAGVSVGFSQSQNRTHSQMSPLQQSDIWATLQMNQNVVRLATNNGQADSGRQGRQETRKI